jgi:hypothetical protein
MSATVTYSDSLIGSLCREVDGIRHRCHYLVSAMERCEHSGLYSRLHNELVQLRQRQQAVLRAARYCQLKSSGDSMGIAFLVDLSARSGRD